MKKIPIIMGILFFSAVSQAFVLPPGYFFQQWATQNKSPQTLLVKQERDLISGGAVVQTIPETVKIRRSGFYKWTSDIPGLEEIKILGKTKATMGTPENRRSVQLQSVLTPVEVALIYSQSGSIESVLKQIGVDVAQYRLELVQKNKEIRVGDSKSNRLYISPDKSTLDAMVFQNQLYLLKYDQDKFSFYPSEIEIYEGEVLKQKVRTKSVLTNAKISEQEFDSK